MSAIVPEFLNFIKNLEENRDTLSPTTTGAPSWPHPQQIAEFEFNNSVCFVCNGYYGPNFGEPVCVTCHSFLFPEIPSVLTVYNFLGDKTDDGDSGNDEPSDLNYKFEWQGDRMKVEFPSRLLREMHELHEQQARRILEGDPDSDDESNEANNQPSGSGTNKNNKHNVPKQRAKKVGQAPPDPVPTLAKSLHALTTPRLPDNLEPGLVEQLPSEVLLCIFSYLDDLSLSECACVCLRWSGLVAAHVPPHRWASFTAHRWPMFKPVLASVDWSKKYRALVESSCCRNCLVQMCVQAKPVENDGRWRWNRLRSELKMLRNDPPEGIAATPIDVNCCHWQASVTGPVGSPYEGGLFYLYIQVPYTYPMSPPVVRFITRILHPNVSRHGDIGIDSVHHNWTLALTISKVIISVQSLLTDPYTGVCMEPELGRMYVQERSRFEELARQWTWRYAMLDVLP